MQHCRLCCCWLLGYRASSDTNKLSPQQQQQQATDHCSAPASGQSTPLPLVFCYRIAPPPKMSPPPADNLPVKIRPARRALDGFLPVSCRPGETFLGRGDPITEHQRQRRRLA